MDLIIAPLAAHLQTALKAFEAEGVVGEFSYHRTAASMRFIRWGQGGGRQTEEGGDRQTVAI